MKKIVYFILLNLFFCSYSSANSVSFICEWSGSSIKSLKRNVIEINNGSIFENSKKIETTLVKLTQKNIEYKYFKVNNLNTKFYYHFKLNIHSGIAFETLKSEDGIFSESYGAICEFI